MTGLTRSSDPEPIYTEKQGAQLAFTLRVVLNLKSLIFNFKFTIFNFFSLFKDTLSLFSLYFF